MIGAGRVGMALAVLLEAARHRVVAATGGEATRERVRRYLKFTTFVPAEEAVRAARSAKVVIIAVPDDGIVDVCTELGERRAFRAAQHVLHLSGSVGLDALQPAADYGAEILSLHPLQTFPDVDTGVARLPGSPIAVTARTEGGFVFGESLALDIGGAPFRLADEVKGLYHAAAVFSSNYLVVVEGMAEHLFKMAGLPDPVGMFAPLARSALEATLTLGPREALTGPAVRGDAGTIARNLAALEEYAPEAVPAYVSLARMAAEMALDAGRLSEEGRKQVEEVLDAWS
jgi:predicted short-subunit dehydrogenase-like oxidoreductase (DUF2520 family)